jgi:hypothetical protein
MELSFRKAGDPGHSRGPPPLAANLADKAFKGSALEKHLLAKGRSRR